VAKGANASQKHVHETPPYQSPASQRVVDNKKQSQSPDLSSRHAHVMSSAASDANIQLWVCLHDCGKCNCVYEMNNLPIVTAQQCLDDSQSRAVLIISPTLYWAWQKLMAAYCWVCD